MWTPSLTTVHGVVSSSPSDWTLGEVLPVFSVSAVTLGICTSALGKWVERVGPRKSGVVGSCCWGGALMLTGLGVELHSLALVYAGYGLLGGVGWGLMYLTPVSTCMKWYPDRRGFATGLALSAFGLGAAIAPPVIHTVLEYFFVMPHFLGEVDGVLLSTLEDGTQVAMTADGEKPVIVATAVDAAKVGVIPGVYECGAGDTGASRALVSLGLLYGSIGALASRFMKIPSDGWTPNHDPSSDPNNNNHNSKDDGSIIPTNVGLPVEVAMSTSQFPLLWISVFGNATGGLALLSSSKLMITDIWAGAMPEIVTASFATGYVAALGSANAMGRFGWAFASDWIGRKNTYIIFSLGIPIVGGAPYLCHAAMDRNALAGMEMLPLATFYGGSILAISFYGGIFSTLPAYIADLFGQKHSGAIHGKLLTAWAASAVCGPMGLAYLRASAVDDAIWDLLNTVDPITFQEKFGCAVEHSQPLITANTVTIARLMEICPQGTVDPTPFLYDTTCYVAAGLIGISALANLAITPLHASNKLDPMQKQKQHHLSSNKI
eukprot:CAMPEP_0195530084 /NCGR_PEP_ID=MMETSP0794_2-20130614/32846_1 /TAXON_ID=515487 /ORGANISM="Stephanopyxis turris, Strain CCMP 815" /LENGTH=547 /DNA_ID=CAMNT_0040661505 /DNA_START=461 /DNA_END=2104 /DNA_ORIENTATION=+